MHVTSGAVPRDDDEPIAIFTLGGGPMTRDVGCAAVLLLPFVAALALLPFDPVRALGAVIMAAITGGLAWVLFGHALHRDLVQRAELYRDALRVRTRAGWIVVPWRELREVTWREGSRWLGSDVLTEDGLRLRLTPWLEHGRACAFLLHHAARSSAFPWEHLEAARWAAPEPIQLDSVAPGFVERARSGRSRCRTCGGLISHGEMRYGRRVPSPRPGRTTTHWHHVDCAEERFGEVNNP